MPTTAGGKAAPCTEVSRASQQMLRTLLSRERRIRPGRQRRAAETGLTDVLLEFLARRDGQWIATYISHGCEPGTCALRAAARDKGIGAVVPVIAPQSGGPCWVLDSAPGSPARRDETAKRRPGARPRASIALVPCLAVDTCGQRLACTRRDDYARLVAQLGGCPLLVGVVYEDEVFDAAVEPVPASPDDLRVQAVATPTRLLVLDPELADRPPPTPDAALPGSH